MFAMLLLECTLSLLFLFQNMVTKQTKHLVLNTFQPNLCFVPCKPTWDVSETFHQPEGSILDINRQLFSSKLCSEKKEFLFNHVFVLFVILIQPLKLKWLCICTFTEATLNQITQLNIMHAHVYFRWFAKITMHKTSRELKSNIYGLNNLN